MPAVAESATVPVPQRLVFDTVGVVGIGFTVTVTDLISLAVQLTPSEVSVAVAVTV